MIHLREFNSLVKKVAEKFPELTLKEVEFIVRCQFEYAQKHISEGTLTPVYYQNLGTFRVKEGARKHILAARKAKLERDADTERKLSGGRNTELPPEKH